MNAPTQTRPQSSGTAMTPAGNGGAVAKQPSEFEAQLAEYEPQIAAALPAHIRPERFRRIVVTAINQTPDLLRADRRSLFNACIRAANDGLLPDGREGALVVFNTKEKIDGKDVWIKKVQWMPMIQGILKRARNTAELASAASHVVYEHDRFTYRLGDDESLEHEPLLTGARGNPIGAYAIAKLKDGTVQREFMTAAEINEVRAVSKSKDGPAWGRWWGEMARKTVARRLFKWLPTSSELTSIFDGDETMQIEDRAMIAPPRPTRTSIAGPGPQIEGTSEPLDEPGTIELVDASGEFIPFQDPASYADAFIVEMRRAPTEADVQGIWETNSPSLDSLRAIGPEGEKLAEEIHAAYGEELDAKRKAERKPAPKAKAKAEPKPEPEPEGDPRPEPPIEDDGVDPAEGDSAQLLQEPADDEPDDGEALYSELYSELLGKTTAAAIHAWNTERAEHVKILKASWPERHKTLIDAANERIKTLSKKR